MFTDYSLFEDFKQRIDNKYGHLYVMSKLLNDEKYEFTTGSIKFEDILHIFVPDDDSILYTNMKLDIFIDGIDIQILRWLTLENIKYEVRRKSNDIKILLEYNDNNINFLMDLIDFIYKNQRSIYG